MKLFNSLLFLALAAGSTLAQAQLYKSVGPDGKVTYSDAPPPSAAKVETRNFDSSTASGAGLPYELAQAVKNSPVTLYSGEKCVPCDEGRKFLNTRGIPFREKTISNNADIKKFHEIAGEDARLPLLAIGRNKLKGFQKNDWSVALTAAGYPESNKLPANYSRPQAEAMAPKQKVVQPSNTAQNSEKTAQEPEQPLPAAGNAPPGFRF